MNNFTVLFFKNGQSIANMNNTNNVPFVGCHIQLGASVYEITKVIINYENQANLIRVNLK